MLKGRGAVLIGLAIGAGLMYVLDPERGRRRRVLIRDRITHARNIGAYAIGATGRDLAHRATGATARLRGTLGRGPIEDRILVERVRAQLGRWVSQPRAIDVESRNGIVTLGGPILKDEAPRLLSAVGGVRGVRDVVSALDERAEAGNIPSLQGGSTSVARSAVRQREWSPTARLLAGTTATALTGYGAFRRDVPGTILAAAGLGLLARSATHRFH